jgi:hypothetical protein
MGIDGEGYGSNRQGQQHYALLSASGGVRPLYRRGRHLTTLECLDWICGLPPGPLLVGFSFGYDATQILRDLPSDRLDRLFEDKEAGEGKSRYTWFGQYAIEYLPKNYLRVARTQVVQRVNPVTKERYTTRQRIEGSSRTIYETFGFFQQSFLSAIKSFEIGAEHWDLIERNKSLRSVFSSITPEVREYCRLECELLASLMEEFRRVCHASGLRPRTWNGAGKLSAYLHTEHETVTAAALETLVPPEVRQLAADAYYGGRFEVTRIGEVPGPVHEADIGSAYPSAMRGLPCLLHGQWRQFWGKPPRGLHVAYVAFRHPKGAPICGLPIRQKDGRLFWPREGQGVYWSTELRSAKRLGAAIRYTMGWAYERRCQCHVFDWVSDLFSQRRALGKDKRGYPLKLGLNSLYGKLAQRVGTPKWGNFIWAGLITAHTRAVLNAAASQSPSDVVMFATDALFTKRKLDLPYGDGLGQWEAKEHERLFIVQPGIYFGASRPKTRGVPGSIFEKHIPNFELKWMLWASTYRDAAPPVVGVPVTLFTGLRLAHARGKPETAGVWLNAAEQCKTACQRTSVWQCAACREFSFDWSRKRAAEPIWETSLCVLTKPAPGAPDLVSVPHPENAAWSLLNAGRMELEEQPDHVDLSPVTN